jgi:hypothetical protein
MWRFRVKKPAATQLDAEHSVVLYPALGQIEPATHSVTVTLSGMVASPGKLTLPRKMLLGVLRRLMRVDRATMETPIFQERIAGFMASGAKSRTLSLELGTGRIPHMVQTRRNGTIYDQFKIDLESAGLERELRHGAWWLPISVSMPAEDERRFEGVVQVIPDHGLSVISDIDDTVKRTTVTCRRTMLRNTFLNEFTIYDDLVDLYRQWARAGTAFHYVSSSPWQLFNPLKQLFDASQLPLGSFHLRSFRWRDQMFGKLFFGKRVGKAPIVTNIVSRFPNRQFVLIGDSGEIDPEIYATVALRYPERVRKILIRRVGGKNDTSGRFAKTFRKLPTQVWSTFEHASEIEKVNTPQ